MNVTHVGTAAQDLEVLIRRRSQKLVKLIEEKSGLAGVLTNRRLVMGGDVIMIPHRDNQRGWINIALFVAGPVNPNELSQQNSMLL